MSPGEHRRKVSNEHIRLDLDSHRHDSLRAPSSKQNQHGALVLARTVYRVHAVASRDGVGTRQLLLKPQEPVAQQGVLYDDRGDVWALDRRARDEDQADQELRLRVGVRGQRAQYGDRDRLRARVGRQPEQDPAARPVLDARRGAVRDGGVLDRDHAGGPAHAAHRDRHDGLRRAGVEDKVGSVQPQHAGHVAVEDRHGEPAVARRQGGAHGAH